MLYDLDRAIKTQLLQVDTGKINFLPPRLLPPVNPLLNPGEIQSTKKLLTLLTKKSEDAFP